MHHSPTRVAAFFLACLAANFSAWLAASAQEKMFLKTGRSLGIMAFSPDGSTLAIVHTPGQQAITLWNLEKREPTATINGTLLSQGDRIRFTEDGTQIAHRWSYGEELSLHYVDLSTGKVARKVKIDATVLEIGEGANVVVTRGAGEDSNQVIIRNLGLKKNTVLERQETRQDYAFFSPDGTLLATADGGSKRRPRPVVNIWETPIGKRRTTISHERWRSSYTPVWGGVSLSISQNNKIIAVHNFRHNGMQFFDVGSGEELGKEINAEFGKTIWPVYGPIVFLPDSKHVASIGHERQDVDIWSVLEQKRVMTLRGTKEEIGNVSLAVSPNGRLIARCNSKGSISIWDVPKLDR